MSHNIRQLIKLTNKMTALADKMDVKPEKHTHVMAGSLRDAAYDLRRKAMKEKGRLQRVGEWEEENTKGTEDQ